MSTIKYDEDFKKSLVTLYQNGKTQAQLCREYGVSESALCKWGSQTIIQIIQNEVYLGHIVSHKHTTKSYKCKKIIDVPKEDWIVVRNVHECLVRPLQIRAFLLSLVKLGINLV